MSRKKQKDMYEFFREALEKVGTRNKQEILRRFMETMLRKAHDNLTFQDLRKIADDLSYEFILDLLSSVELAKSVCESEYDYRAAGELIKRFLQANSVGRRRAML